MQLLSMLHDLITIFPDAVMATSIEIKEKGVDECGHVLYDDINLKLVVNATTHEAKLKLIIEDILPKLSLDASTAVPYIVLTLNTASTHVSEDPDLRNIYTAIAKHFGRTASEAGYKRFLEAVNEVSVAKMEACNNRSPDHSNRSQLLQEFAIAYQLEDKSSQHSVRSRFGKLLCHDSTEQSRVRRDTLSLDVDSRKCECPPGGINGTDWSKFESCDFYACLTDGQIFQRIFFTDEYKLIDYQCLAFVIDTTGSMSQEVNTAKRVILDFVRSEQEIGVDGCYILVPFNDVGPDDKIVAEQSKFSLIDNPSHSTLMLVL